MATEHRKKLREDLMRWFWNYENTVPDDLLDSAEFEEFEEKFKTFVCEFVGEHDPTPDQCNKPEHDFCLWCLRRTPNAYPRKPKE